MCMRVYSVSIDGRGNIIVMHLAKLVSNGLCFRMLKNNSLVMCMYIIYTFYMMMVLREWVGELC